MRWYARLGTTAPGSRAGILLLAAGLVFSSSDPSSADLEEQGKADRSNGAELGNAWPWVARNQAHKAELEHLPTCLVVRDAWKARALLHQHYDV